MSNLFMQKKVPSIEVAANSMWLHIQFWILVVLSTSECFQNLKSYMFQAFFNLPRKVSFQLEKRKQISCKKKPHPSVRPENLNVVGFRFSNSPSFHLRCVASDYKVSGQISNREEPSPPPHGMSIGVVYLSYIL